MYEIPGELLNNALVIAFPLHFFKELPLPNNESRPLLLMVSKKRSVLIDLQAFIEPGIEPARCWLNRRHVAADRSVAYGLAGVSDTLPDTQLEKYQAETAILGRRDFSVCALLPEADLRDTLISYQHFAIAVEYLQTLDTKAAHVTDLLLFFKTFIRLLQSKHDDDDELSDRKVVWRLFSKCASIVDQDQDEMPVELNAEEKQRWTMLLQKVKTECNLLR